MAKLTDRVGDLEHKTEALIISNKLYLEDRKERNKKLDTMVDTVVNMDKKMSNLITQIKGDGGLFKRVNSLEDKSENTEEDIEAILLSIAKKSGRDARIIAFVVALSFFLGWVTDKIGDYYVSRIENRSKVETILYHKPFEYGISTKVL